MDIVINTDRSDSLKNYNDSLFEVFVLDYDDNYHKIGNEPTNEFERSVRNLKARYKDLAKFNEALIIYSDWMAYLAEKHGGPDILKKKIKAGVIDDFVPRKPRLKNIKKLKYLYKHGIYVSPVDLRNMVDDDELDEYLDENFPESELKKIKFNVDVTSDKFAEKLSKEFSDADIRRYKSKTFVSDADFLESFFNSKNKTKNKKKISTKKEPILLKDLMSDNYVPGVEDSDNSTLMVYDNLLLSAGTTKDIDMYHKIDDCGWQSYKLMKRANYSKRMTSMFKAQKKSKKKKKKNKSGYDDLLIDIMTDNGYDDFEDFQKEMLSMTSKDLFN